MVRVMPRSAHLYKIDPEVVKEVTSILLQEGKEYVYDEKKNLGLYTKSVTRGDGYYVAEILIDYTFLVSRKERKNGEIIVKREEVKSVDILKTVYIPKIKGSSEIDHIMITLSKQSLAKLLTYAIERITGRIALLKIQFDFSPSKQKNIINQFDDIVRITSDDVNDIRIIGLSLKGHSLYAAQEFKKAFTGIVRYLGVRIGNEWFLLSREGRIITYKLLNDNDFIERIRDILRRLAHAHAIIV